MPIVDVLLPQSGMGMQDGEIVRWVKNVGDEVVSGETLVEIEAAKATIEVPSPSDGVLIEIVAQVGEVIEVRAVIAKIEAQ